MARTRQAAASTQFTMVSIVSPSFTLFVFSSSSFSPRLPPVRRQRHIQELSASFFSSFVAKFVSFCRILFPAHHRLCQSCTISRVTRVPISTIVEIISTSLVCCSVSRDYLPETGSSGKLISGSLSQAQLPVSQRPVQE